MIRDPSDGTVRETAKSGPDRKAPHNSGERLPSSDAASSGPDTGLRQPTRTDAQERLERSREFVRDYHAKKEREHAARGNNDEAQYSQNGNSSVEGA
jgi:hypothetical protein